MTELKFKIKTPIKVDNDEFIVTSSNVIVAALEILPTVLCSISTVADDV